MVGKRPCQLPAWGWLFNQLGSWYIASLNQDCAHWKDRAGCGKFEGHQGLAMCTSARHSGVGEMNLTGPRRTLKAYGPCCYSFCW